MEDSMGNPVPAASITTPSGEMLVCTDSNGRALLEREAPLGLVRIEKDGWVPHEEALYDLASGSWYERTVRLERRR